MLQKILLAIYACISLLSPDEKLKSEFNKP